MNETIEQSGPNQSPLAEAHRLRGATFSVRDGASVPAHYMGAGAEYEAVRGGGAAGLIDLSTRGRIEVSGAEAVQFLNGLITNDMKTLAAGAWMPAAFPNVQGRLLAQARVLRPNEEQSFLIDTEAATRERVHQTLARFTLAGDFRVRDLSGETAQLSVQGARARVLIDTALGVKAGGVERGRVASVAWRDNSLTILRATHTGEDGFDLIVGARDARALWDALIEVGAQPVGYEALEVLRVEAGEPRYGVDMTETSVVLEAGLDEAVSYTKGCYVGQEIIARIHWRGHVAKRLAGIVLADDRALDSENKIRSVEGKEIGRITSSVFSPRLQRTIALGYLKYDYLKPETEIVVASADEERRGRVVELPFVRGSWNEVGAESSQ